MCDGRFSIFVIVRQTARNTFCFVSILARMYVEYYVNKKRKSNACTHAHTQPARRLHNNKEGSKQNKTNERMKEKEDSHSTFLSRIFGLVHCFPSSPRLLAGSHTRPATVSGRRVQRLPCLSCTQMALAFLFLNRPGACSQVRRARSNRTRIWSFVPRRRSNFAGVSRVQEKRGRLLFPELCHGLKLRGWPLTLM